MKSYLRFLGRNKIYTAIEVVGLSIALAFVILLGSHVVDEMSYDEGVDTEGLYSCLVDFTEKKRMERMSIFERIPQIETACFFRHMNAKEDIASLPFGVIHEGEKFITDGIITDPGFITMFPFEFTEGSAEEALTDADDMIISESLASMMFPDGSAVGNLVSIEGKGYDGMTYTISGVYKDMKKTAFKPADFIFMNRDDLPDGAIEMNSSYFLKLAEGADIHEVEEVLNDEFNRGVSYSSQLTLTPFKELRGKSGSWFLRSFSNTYDKKVIDIYMIMCLLITIFSMMNYIALTIAFSRFRLKEIAMRRLLGTNRLGIICRCFAETVFLLTISAIFAVLIALALKDPISGILGADLHPMKNGAEYIIIGTIILIVSLLASVIPSASLSMARPIHVIKGEERQRDKMYLSKTFIFLEGALSIFSVAVTLAISLQTMEMLKKSLGYETDNLTFVQFQVDQSTQRFYHELLSQSYVEKIGNLETPPMSTTFPSLTFTDDAGNSIDCYEFMCNQTGRELLGIEILEEWTEERVGDLMMYICSSSAEKYGYMIQDNMLIDRKSGFAIPVNGVVSDFSMGNVKSDEIDGMISIQINAEKDYIPEHIWDNLIIKTTGDEDDACNMIREFYESRGYDDKMFKADTLNDIMREQVKSERQTQALMMIFAIVSLLLTSMVIIALSSFYAQLNAYDTAVRKIFGISKREVFWKTVWAFTAPVVIAGIVAVPVAYLYISRWLEAYHVRINNSPAIYVTAMALVLSVTIGAVVLQSLRLMRTNPAEALKKE